TLLDFHMARQTAATLAVYRVADPSRCGIVTLSQTGLVTSFVEKPPMPSSNLAFAGVLIGTHQLLEEIPNSVPADFGFDVLSRMVNKMSAYEVSDYLLDIGTVSNYRQAQATWPGLSQGTRVFAAMIFDLDGVIADTHPMHKQAWRQLLLEQG